MTERQLECFLSLARTLSFSETASQLHLTQPAVSQQIRALEEYVGVPLLLRSKHSVSLTPAGIAFCSDAQDLMNQRKLMCLRARNCSSSYSSLLSISCMMPLTRMPDILKRFHQQHPNVLININPLEQNTLNPYSFYNRADISIAFGNPQTDYDQFQFIPLYSGDFICLLSNTHPLAQKSRIHITDLHNETIFTLSETLENTMLRTLHTYLAAHHHNGLLRTLSSFFDISAFVGAGIGIGVAPALIQKYSNNCSNVPFDYPDHFHLGLFTLKDASTPVLDFCKIAQSLCHSGDNIVQY